MILQIGQLNASVEEEGGPLACRDEFKGERRRSARLSQEPIEDLISVARIVVKRDEAFDLGHGGKGDRVRDGAVAPPHVPRVLASAVLGIVDEDVDASRQREP